MPYIRQEDRTKLAYGDYKFPENAGELNYVLTLVVHKYMRDKGIKYQHYNDVIGALEGCKLELYRRYVSPYEDVKIKDNGDVNGMRAS